MKNSLLRTIFVYLLSICTSSLYAQENLSLYIKNPELALTESRSYYQRADYQQAASRIRIYFNMTNDESCLAFRDSVLFCAKHLKRGHGFESKKEYAKAIAEYDAIHKYTGHAYLLEQIDSLQKEIVRSDYVLIPAGTLKNYITGWSSNYEHHTYANLDMDAYYICKHEVTQKEYKDIIGMNPSIHAGDSIPVHNITCLEAIDYCERKSKREGYQGFYTISGNNVVLNKNGSGYRLPTQYEWAFAARGVDGKRLKYASGNDLKSIAWYGGNSGNKPHIIETRVCNSRGIYDMTGNVAEYLWPEKSWKNNFFGWFHPSSYELYIGLSEEDVHGCDFREGLIDIGFRVVLITVSESNRNLRESADSFVFKK